MLEGIEERSAERRKRMVGHVAKNFAEAEAWDLEFWQSLTPQERVAAAGAIQHDVELVEQGKRKAEQIEEKTSGGH